MSLRVGAESGVVATAVDACFFVGSNYCVRLCYSDETRILQTCEQKSMNVENINNKKEREKSGKQHELKQKECSPLHQLVASLIVVVEFNLLVSRFAIAVTIFGAASEAALAKVAAATSRSTTRRTSTTTTATTATTER